jgi:hypothetical protein
MSITKQQFGQAVNVTGRTAFEMMIGAPSESHFLNVKYAYSLHSFERLPSPHLIDFNNVCRISNTKVVFITGER